MADDDAVAMFTAVTAASTDVALGYLEAAAGDVQAAIDLYFESGGEAGAPPPPPPGAGDGEDDEGSDYSADEPMDVDESDPLEGSPRLQQLRARLLSPDVRVPAPAEAEEVPATLDAGQVAAIFERHVSGVRSFKYRDTGETAMKFITLAYESGLKAFEGTPVHDHLLWLLRLAVHHGHEDKPDSARYLREVAEAFMDCQAVQGRVIERVGLEIRGVVPNFRGAMVALVGEYKIMAIKMLATVWRRKGGDDDENPTHYENRLTADLGFDLGLNEDNVRLAKLDKHARERHSCLTGARKDEAVDRCRKLFDVNALLQAFVAEANSFNADSPANSTARLFLDWVSETLAEKHVVFDEETCSRVDIELSLALAVFEFVFLGSVCAPEDETYRDLSLRDLFGSTAGGTS